MWFPGVLWADIEIRWSSDLDVVNVQSDGTTPLDGSFEFFIGSFEGLVPDAGNVADWMASFRVFDTTAYDPETGRFASVKDLVSNAPPFAIGTRAYVWGRNGTGSGSEWILFGRPSWTWPDAAPNPLAPPPLPLSWLTQAVGREDVVLGSVNEGGWQLRTARVVLDLSYPDWAGQVFLPGDDASAGGDPDGDGRSNFLEYAVGSDPREEDRPFEVGWNANREIEVNRAPGREVQWVVQVSEDLEEFTDLDGGVAFVVDEPDRLVFRIENPGPGQRFFRVAARQPD